VVLTMAGRRARCSTSPPAPRRTTADRPYAGSSPSPGGSARARPIAAPCTQCLRHGDPMHAPEWLTSGEPVIRAQSPRYLATRPAQRRAPPTDAAQVLIGTHTNARGLLSLRDPRDSSGGSGSGSALSSWAGWPAGWLADLPGAAAPSATPRATPCRAPSVAAAAGCRARRTTLSRQSVAALVNSVTRTGVSHKGNPSQSFNLRRGGGGQRTVDALHDLAGPDQARPAQICINRCVLGGGSGPRRSPPAHTHARARCWLTGPAAACSGRTAGVRPRRRRGDQSTGSPRGRRAPPRRGARRR
jgi:hypothetical protein